MAMSSQSLEMDIFTALGFGFANHRILFWLGPKDSLSGETPIPEAIASTERIMEIRIYSIFFGVEQLPICAYPSQQII